MKFDNVLAEAAYVIAGHGFAEDEFGTSEDITGWNAAVAVSRVVLLNLGEDTLAAAFDHGHGGAQYLVWIRENSYGFVSVIDYGSDGGLRSGSDLVGRMFDAAAADA